MASGRELARLQRRMTGKHSHFELNGLSAALQEVVDAPHPLPAILSMVETRHRDHSQVVDRQQIE